MSYLPWLAGGAALGYAAGQRGGRRALHAGKHFAYCIPDNDLLYVEAKKYDNLVGLLRDQRWRAGAHLRTREGSTPYSGGGIAFHLAPMVARGVRPNWWVRKGRTYNEAYQEAWETGLYEDQLTLNRSHTIYPQECEWSGPRFMRFDLSDIAYVWLGSVRWRQPETVPALVKELEGLLLPGTKIISGKPSPTLEDHHLGIKDADTHLEVYGRPKSGYGARRQGSRAAEVERIEIEEGDYSVPRYAWHTVPWVFGKIDPSQGLPSYQPSKTAELTGEAEAIREAYGPGRVEREGIVWLAPEWEGTRPPWKSYAKQGYRIDLAKLDPDRLRYSFQSEGFVWHLGPIPPEAIVGGHGRRAKSTISFKKTKSPLEYRTLGTVERIALCDSSVTHKANDHYLEDEAPCIVGFLDFEERGSGDHRGYFVHYMWTGSGLERRGYARKLVDEFYRRYARKVGPRGDMDWGKLMHKASEKMFREKREEYKGRVYHRGKFGWAALTRQERSVERAIKAVLPACDALRHPPWRGSPDPVAGHCYVASEVAYHLLGGKAAGYTPMFVRHEGASHWFLRTPEGKVFDITAAQFRTPVPYDKAKGQGFIPTSHRDPRTGVQLPSKRAQTLIARVQGKVDR